jgi:hypothetical protein
MNKTSHEVVIQGFVGGVQTEETETVSSNEKFWFTAVGLSWDPVDKMRIVATDIGIETLSMDNFVLVTDINLIPIPAAMWLFGGGRIWLLGLRKGFKN